MKRSLFTCFILFFTFPAFVQIPAGTRLREKSGLFDHHQTYFKTAALTYSHIAFSAYQGRAVRENRFRGWYLSSTLDISLASGTGWEPLVSAGYFNRRY
ncbi:MAG: hypothetical protein J7576_20995, partial [Siphonobacter aquaeclarae]|nr:hypothetical protein [Siphonobacter aquaeclarae]